MENIFLFILMSIFFVVLPGPDLAVITKNTVTGGQSGGVKTLFGISCSLLIHTTAAAFGLSALIVNSVLLFNIFKYVGAAYLLYLGVKSLWSMRSLKSETAHSDEVSPIKIKGTSFFKQGFLTSILNPKVALLFFTFFPPFMATGANPFVIFLIMGVIYTILTVIWSLIYIFLLEKISMFIKQPRTQQWIEGITGVVLILFAVKLFFEKAET